MFWYSFEVGNVHVAVISSEHDPSPGSEMGDWLEDDLLGVDRAATPWVVLATHRPYIFTQKSTAEQKMAVGLTQIVEPLLAKAKVDLVFAGHIHSFQRTCAMFNYSCTKPGEHGTVHYMNGAAGHPFSTSAPFPSTYMENTILSVHGYTVFTAPNATHLHMEFFGNTNNTVLDDTWLVQSFPR